jgi:hypothetical protein
MFSLVVRLMVESQESCQPKQERFSGGLALAQAIAAVDVTAVGVAVATIA